MNTPIEITHVVYADAIAYSRLSFDRKRVYDEAIASLSAKAFAGLDVIARVDNGDGFAIAVRGEPLPVVHAALGLAEALEAQTGVKTRFGVHTGLAYARPDLAGHESLTGPAIELAQRVMSVSSGIAVLVSRAMRDLLAAYPEFVGRIAPGSMSRTKDGAVVATYRVFLQAKKFVLLFSESDLGVPTFDGVELISPSGEFFTESVAEMLAFYDQAGWIAWAGSETVRGKFLAEEIAARIPSAVRLAGPSAADQIVTAMRALSPRKLVTEGPVPLGAEYVERHADELLQRAIRDRESVILLRGPKGFGKSSTLLRIPSWVRSLGARELFVDLGAADEATMDGIEGFYRWLVNRLVRSAPTPMDAPAWEDWIGPNSNLENAMLKIAEQGDIVVVFDGVDRLFDRPYRHDFFGLLRSWHNRRAVAMEPKWDRMSILLAYAGDAQAVLLDVNQSPFNVGRRIELEPFRPDQVAQLCAGTNADAQVIYNLASGHPQLTTMLVSREVTLEDAAVITEHVRHSPLIRQLGSQLEGSLREAIEAVMTPRKTPSPGDTWVLAGLGLVSLRPDGTAQPSNRIFAELMAAKLRGK
jgi:hypothetical protein